MKSRRLRLVLAVVVFLLSLMVLLLSAWPLPREQHAIPLETLVLPDRAPLTSTAQPETVQPAIPGQRHIMLEWPARIRAQDNDWVVLSLLMGSGGQVTASLETPGSTREPTTVAIPNLYDTHNVVAVARLDLAGLGAWREPLRETMRPGRPVTFRWSIQGGAAGVHRGVIWLSLEFVPLTGGRVEPLILLSRPITINTVTILGLPGWVGRVFGGAGLVLSVLFCFLWVRPVLAAYRGRSDVTENSDPPAG